MEIPIGDWTVRSWRRGDEPALVRYANNRNVWRNLTDAFPHPYTMGDAMSWIERATAQQPETAFAIASGAEAIGGIGFDVQGDVYRRAADIGYWLGEPFWGRGIATMALRAVAEHAFASFDLVRLQATVFEWNPASARVLEKAGFALEGRLRRSVTKDGRTIDGLLYALVRDGQTPPRRRAVEPC